MADLETKQVNSLYRRINNEAVDEDKQANRRAIEFSKKQARLFSPDKKQAKVLSKKDFQNLKKVISKFSTALNKYTLAYSKGDINENEVEDISNIQGQYDLLCLFLAGISLDALDKPDYDLVTSELDKLIPKLGEVRRLIDAVQGNLDETIFARRVIAHIIQNFRAHTYYPFGSYTNEDIVEVGRLIGEERVREMREQIEVGEEPEEQELPGEARQLPIGVPIPDEDILDELEQDKVTLTEIYSDLNDFRNVADDATRRAIIIRQKSIEENITLIDNVLDGRYEATEQLVNHITASIRYLQAFVDALEQRYQ